MRIIDWSSDVCSSDLSFSANFPGEFGGGVINLTTKAIPAESYLEISGGSSANTETSGQHGYTYYGSDSDWTGFDDGSRDVPAQLAHEFKRGIPFVTMSSASLKGVDMKSRKPKTTVLKRDN